MKKYSNINNYDNTFNNQSLKASKQKIDNITNNYNYVNIYEKAELNINNTNIFKKTISHNNNLMNEKNKMNFIKSKQFIKNKRKVFPNLNKSQTNKYSSKNLNSLDIYEKNPLFINKNTSNNKIISNKKLFLNIQNSNDDTEYIEDYTIQKKYYTNFYENNHNYKKYKSSENIIDIDKYININKNLKLKIYKKAVEQSFNKLLKFCYTIIKDDISKFICELKKSSSSNNDNHKAYKRKNVINRNLIKIKKTPLNSSKKEKTGKIFSPLSSFKKIRMEKLRFQENYYNNKKNEIYSNNYNLNNFEETENHCNTIQGNLSYNIINSFYNQNQFKNESKNEIYVKKINIKSKNIINSI